MDTQSTVNVALGVGFTVLGWFAREMWAAVKELKSDLAHLREELPKQYITKDDYREDVREHKDDIREIKELIAKIFDKLDAKQDRRSTD